MLQWGGDWLYGAFDLAMRANDAKYKIYLDDHVAITNKNFLVELIEIFRADKKIGAVGVSGAIELSTHGVSLSSVKRGGRIFSGEQNPQPVDWGNFGEAQIIDGFFIATQYDLPWRTDFEDDFFGGQAHSVEFKRKGYKIFIAAQDLPWIWYRKANFTFDEPSRQKFLAEYSADLFPLVTVIIPTFNRPKYFREALESVLNQTYRNIEIVISDDSTNDATEALIQNYLDNPRIKYFRNRGFTASDNWNFLRAYNNPVAEYVNWLMDDDLFYPTKIERMIEIYRNNPDVSLVTSARSIIDAQGNLLGDTKYIFGQDVKLPGEEAGKFLFLQDNYIGELTTVLIRKKFLRDNDLCWNADDTGENFALPDVSTFLQLLSKGNMVRLIECLSGFRSHAEQQQKIDAVHAITLVSWAKLLKSAWEKKIYIKNEHEYRLTAMRIISISSNELRGFYTKNNYSKEIKLLEKTLTALMQALTNNFELELPPDTQAELKIN